jgi:hypothetical protein
MLAAQAAPAVTGKSNFEVAKQANAERLRAKQSALKKQFASIIDTLSELETDGWIDTMAKTAAKVKTDLRATLILSMGYRK